MDIKKHILKQLVLNQKLRYNQLLSTTDADSNKFNYHLQKIIKQGIIEKQNDHYTISEQGKTIVAFMDTETGEIDQKPTFATIEIERSLNKEKFTGMNMLSTRRYS